eukprot:gene6405-10412_t
MVEGYSHSKYNSSSFVVSDISTQILIGQPMPSAFSVELQVGLEAIFHIPIAVLFTCFILFSVGFLLKTMCFGNDFPSENNLLFSLSVYSILRLLYFISTLFIFGDKLSQITFVCFDFEVLIISGGKNVNIMKREMLFHRSSMHILIISIHLIQICISTFRIIYGIPNHIFDLPEFVQSFFHIALCFLLCIVFYVFSKASKAKAWDFNSDSDERKKVDKIYYSVLLCGCMIFIRGVLNVCLLIFEAFSFLRANHSDYMKWVNSLFSFFCDVLPTVFVIFNVITFNISYKNTKKEEIRLIGSRIIPENDSY